MSSYNWAQRPMQQTKDINGLAVTMSFPWWVWNPFICHQQIPLQMWGHFLPGKKVLTSLPVTPEWWFKGWSQTATTPHCLTRPLRSCHLFLSPPRDARKYNSSQWCWMDWWAHQSRNLSCMHQFAPKDCGPCHSDTGFEWIQGASYLVNLQATKAD